MKTSFPRTLAVAVLAALFCLLLVGARAAETPTLQPDKLVILSTTDVKGKTDPCG